MGTHIHTHTQIKNTSWKAIEEDVMLPFPRTLMYIHAHQTFIHAHKNSGGEWRNAHPEIGAEAPAMWQE